MTASTCALRKSRGQKIALRYRDEHGRDSERTIWPIAIGYHERWRPGASCAGLAAFAPIAWSMPIIDEISRKARRAAGEMAAEHGVGTAERTVIGVVTAGAGGAALNRRDEPAPRQPSKLRRMLLLFGELAALHHRGRRGAQPYPGEICQRTTIRHALRGNRCSALSGEIGVATSCVVYAVRRRSAAFVCPAMPNATWRAGGTGSTPSSSQRLVRRSSKSEGGTPERRLQKARLLGNDARP